MAGTPRSQALVYNVASPLRSVADGRLVLSAIAGASFGLYGGFLCLCLVGSPAVSARSLAQWTFPSIGALGPLAVVP